MTEPTRSTDVPTLALQIDQAAASIGVSENHFRRYVLPNVRTVKVGRIRLVPVIEIERWLYLYSDFAQDGD